MTQVFLPFFFLMLAGAFWSLWHNPAPGLQAPVVRTALSTVVMRFFLPALTLDVFSRAEFHPQIFWIPLLAGTVCLASALLAWTLYQAGQKARLWKLDPASLGALLLAAGWSNATYLGLPVLGAWFGDSARQIGLAFDLLALTPLLLTVGASFGIRWGTLAAEERSRHPAWTERAFSLLKLPPIWGAVFGIGLNLTGLALPSALQKAVALAGSAVAPMMIFCVGLALPIGELRRARGDLVRSIPALGLKLLFAPFALWGLGHVIGVPATLLQPATVEAAMPTMVLTLAISDQYGLNTRLLAVAIGLGTILSFLTIPAWMSVLF